MSDSLVGFRTGSLFLPLKSGYPVDPSAQRDLVQTIATEINRLVKESPIVSKAPDQEIQWDRGFYDCVYGSRTFVAFSTPVIFVAHWPQKNQDFHIGALGWGDYKGPAVEEFRIAFDGFGFAVAAPCEGRLPRPYSFMLGREAGRILKSILGTSDRWEVAAIGPTPMFISPYAFFTDSPNTATRPFEPLSDGDTLECVTQFQSPPKA